MTTNAIILAAGVGSRLRPLTDSLPKSCIKVGNTSILRRICEQLKSADPEIEITVVTGFAAEKIHVELGEMPFCVGSVHNPDFETTNNMESCRLALCQVPEAEKTIIVNADCMYDDEIVGKMVNDSCDSIAVDSSQFFEENMKVMVADDRIVDIRKTLEEGDNVFTSIDLYCFSARTIQKLKEIMRNHYENDDLQKWNEVAIAQLVMDESYRLRPVDHAGMKWMEIDNHQDLKAARGLFENAE